MLQTQSVELVVGKNKYFMCKDDVAAALLDLFQSLLLHDSFKSQNMYHCGQGLEILE